MGQPSRADFKQFLIDNTKPFENAVKDGCKSQNERNKNVFQYEEKVRSMTRGGTVRGWPAFMSWQLFHDEAGDDCNETVEDRWMDGPP
ncbi:hypothetical protein NPIL_330461 [Nephila pilipes]|uniref:Uncharacterized protein n=1 Tax=Nephila pilipes TaxID=299642 RepID=A0A8X6QPD2_NEPPI|nr:hypothetical protein NPIL_330461 [Nephila pilipes]